VQGELERAISAIAPTDVTIVAAGRTDSGVHARGQVISFELAWRHGDEALQRAINANLPPDVVILSLAETVADFHPRYGAGRRTYEYHLYNEPLRSPLRRRRSWHVPHPLDVERMNEASAHLVGAHDFATFGQPPQGESTVRHLFRAGWRRQDSLIIFGIEGNAFLYRMVRSIVGSLKMVGDGSWSVQEFVDAFHAGDRSRAGPTAPPHGLYLVAVAYDEQQE